MMGYGRWLLAVMLLLVSVGLAAKVPEVPRFRVLGVAQGLPSTTITAIARDRKGYLWVATWDGVARYDGVNFHVWRHEADDPRSLPGNIVQALHIDAQDRIWVATENGGVSMMGPRRDGFVHYRKADYPLLGSDDVFAITSRGDDVWFGTYDAGLTRLDGRGQMHNYSQQLPAHDGLPSNTVLSLAFDARGTLWIGTLAGLARHDRNGFKRVSTPGGDDAMVYSVSVVGDEVWAGTSQGAFRWRPADGWHTPAWSGMFARPNAVTAVTSDQKGEYWLASQRGLWHTMGERAPVPMNDLQQDSRVVQALLMQDDGGLWVSIPTRGLGYLRADWRRIAAYTTEHGLRGGLYRGLAASHDGGIWLAGSRATVEYLDTSSGEVSVLEAPWQDYASRLLSAHEDSHGLLWLGYRSGLIRVDPATGKTVHWSSGPRSDGQQTPDGSSVDWLAETPDGVLWLATQIGNMQRRDLVTGKVIQNLDNAAMGSEEVGEIYTMLVGPHGRLWIANASGLRVWNDDLRRFDGVPGTGGEKIFDFVFDGPDHLWVHRLSGLESWRRNKQGWTLDRRLRAADDVPAVESTGMALDKRGRLWLATRRGLYRIQPGTVGGKVEVRNFGVRDGLISQEFNDRALLLTDDGILAGAAADGSVIVLDTTLDDPAVVRPNLVVDKVTIARGDQLSYLPAVGGFELKPDAHEFEVSMRLLTYEDPMSNRYLSHLDGFDKGWVDQGANGDRVFSALPPGSYTLHMQAFDNAGNSSPVREISFRVLPPWWASVPGIAGLALLGLSLVLTAIFGYRRRLRRITSLQLAEHKREVAEQASQAKTRFLATLGHEVRTPMTGVMGMSELLLATPLDEQQRSHTLAIQRAGVHLLRLVNDALDLAQIEAGKLQLQSQPFDLRELIDDVVGLSRPLAQRKGLAFNVQVAPQLPVMMQGDPVRMRQILLNLLGNAIKFTEKGAVGLQVEARPQGGVRLRVEDTGPGINVEQQSRLFRRFEQAEGVRTTARYGGSGLGLAICQELALAMGGNITLDSTPGLGTRFVVELPLGKVKVPAQDVQAHDAGEEETLSILLVEDDVTVAEVIAGLLRARGHQVRHVLHGLAALGEIATLPFDLAMLDLDLPGLDGLALARQMRLAGFSAPLLAITARADLEAEEQVRDAGFTGFLRKPATGAMLATAVHRAMRGQPWIE